MAMALLGAAGTFLLASNRVLQCSFPQLQGLFLSRALATASASALSRFRCAASTRASTMFLARSSCITAANGLLGTKAGPRMRWDSFRTFSARSSEMMDLRGCGSGAAQLQPPHPTEEAGAAPRSTRTKLLRRPPPRLPISVSARALPAPLVKRVKKDPWTSPFLVGGCLAGVLCGPVWFCGGKAPPR
eukprot:CAMPEP_0118961938 /NCGR_PEP_ID=MMETSP1173-20130426/454_1 /TAXON_ID=1034831 /ORGANISM="Rhizochromulina marina cf, Strain CCMP1243" /LENGTH=187 /DNA_ID=CAMNT_0006910143 /DNA_START=116 /DNA_END=676 /DNA_ORIENTATION=+